MNASDELDLHNLMESVPLCDLLRAMGDRAVWYATRPVILPKHSAYWIDSANVLNAAALAIKEET